MTQKRTGTCMLFAVILTITLLLLYIYNPDLPALTNINSSGNIYNGKSSLLLTQRANQCLSKCLNGDCIVDKCFCIKGYSGQWCDEGNLPNCPGPKDDLKNFPLECMGFFPDYGYPRLPDQFVPYWNDAQAWELEHWVQHPTVQDRADQHLEWMKNYTSLKELLVSSDHRLGNLVEVGCGPFTQSIPMIQHVGFETLSSMTLIDPLIDLYIQKVKYVSYRDIDRSLFGKPTTLIRMAGEPVGDMLRENYYDTVVMLNVIEHGINAAHILNSLWRILRPGGILVFHEYDYADRGFITDPGHPIKLHSSYYDLLLKHFEVVYRRDFNHEGNYMHTMGVYFIGRKPN